MVASTWRLPDAPLRTSAVATSLAALAAGVLLAALAQGVLPLGAVYAVKASIAFAAAMTIAIGFLQQHHPFERVGAANQITTVRALLVSLVAGVVGEPRTVGVAAAATAVAVAATMLDGVDGWLARRHRTASDFGARFDMEIDALLILALSLLAWRFGKAGAWVVLSGALRYAFVAAGFVWSWMRAPLPPSLRRKAVCVMQIAGLTAAVAPIVAPQASAIVAALCLAALAWSFLVDTLWLWRRAV
jgi:phosphatidylglycerophosphate synthase